MLKKVFSSVSEKHNDPLSIIRLEVQYEHFVLCQPENCQTHLLEAAL